MPIESKQDVRVGSSTEVIDLVIRVGLLALLAYWALAIIAPFFTIMVWSAILTVALFPAFRWLEHWVNSPKLAATLLTFLCMLVILAPVAWLGFGLFNGFELVAKNLDAGVSIPLPPESIKHWPIVGVQIYRLWARAVTDISSQLAELAPALKPLAAWLVQMAANVLVGLLKFLLSIIVAGFLFCPGPKLVEVLTQLIERILRPRGTEMVELAGATIRNVSRGVIGVALLQSFLAGVGFFAAGVPGAGILAFASLVLGILQIGPAVLFLPVIIWSWLSQETMNAFLFTVYMTPVGLIDNILRPILMARGLSTPMLVIIIGVLGGTIAYGIIGLFVGPIVLSVAWELGLAWMRKDDPARKEQISNNHGLSTCDAES
jgi:predicted PurR-regulated permease PerM